MIFKKVEKERKKFKFKKDLFTIISFFILLIGLIFFILNFYLDKYNPFDNFFLYLGIAIIVLSIITFALSFENNDNKYIKLLIYIEKRAIKEIYPEYSKFNNKYFNIELFDDNLILEKPLCYSFEKSFEGKIDSKMFYFSNFNFQYSQVITDKNGSKISSVPIDGTIIIFDLKDSNIFKGNNIENTILYIRFTKNIGENSININGNFLEKVRYESNEFNDMFDVFSNDKLFAFKVISPKTIIGLSNLFKSLKDKKLAANSYNNFSIIFNKNKVYVFLKIHPIIYGLNIDKQFDEKEYLRMKKQFELPLDFFKALDLNK